MKKEKIFWAIILIILGIAFRSIWHLGPNIEFVTGATFLAACYLGKRWAIIVPLVIMAVSDSVIGNTSIFIFTWSAYIISGVASYWGFRLKDSSPIFRIIKATGFGLASSLWFYLWTNLGVFLLDSWEMYPNTLSGLLNAYFLGLPFLKLNIIGNLVMVPTSFIVVEFSQRMIVNINKKLFGIIKLF